MSLIEVMVAATLSSILLGVVISLAVRLQQWDRQFRNSGVRSSNAERLTESLRSDIRNAKEVSLADKSNIALTTVDHQEIHYELLPDGCQRTVKRAENATESHDSFIIGSSGSWHVERDASGRRSAIIASFEETPREGENTNPSLYVHAIVGANSLDDVKTANSQQSKPAQ